MKILRKRLKHKEIIMVDGQKAKWLTLNQRIDNSYMVRYQLLDDKEVKTEYYTTMIFTKGPPRGLKPEEVIKWYDSVKSVELELIQKINQPDAEWVWQRQIKRGVIV